MAPHKRGKVPTAFDQDLVASIIQHEDDIWDSSPMRMPGWYAKLRKDIPTADAAFDALIRRGYRSSRGKVCCVNSNHGAALMDKSFGPFDYDEPAPSDPSTHPALMAKAMIGFSFTSDPTSTATTPPGLTATAASTPTVLSNRYVEAPEEIDSLDLALNQWILSRIGNETVRDDYETQSGGSGRDLLRILGRDAAKALSPKAASALLGCLTSLFEVGLPSPSVPSFNDLSGAAKRINQALPLATGKRRPDSMMAESLAGVVSRISDKMETALFVRMQLQSAEGDLTKTTKCILEVLGDADAESGRSNMVGYGAVGQGRGKDKGKDANKDRKPGPGPKDTWNSREWGPCRWKSQFGCDGKHFNAKCPKRAEAEAAKTAGTAVGAAGLVASPLRTLLDGVSGESKSIELGPAGNEATGARGAMGAPTNHDHQAAVRLTELGLMAGLVDNDSADDSQRLASSVSSDDEPSVASGDQRQGDADGSDAESEATSPPSQPRPQAQPPAAAPATAEPSSHAPDVPPPRAHASMHPCHLTICAVAAERRSALHQEMYSAGMPREMLDGHTTQFSAKHAFGPWPNAEAVHSSYDDLASFVRSSWLRIQRESGADPSLPTKASPNVPRRVEPPAAPPPAAPPASPPPSKPSPALDAVEAIQQHPLKPSSFSASSVLASAEILRAMRRDPSYSDACDTLHAGNAIAQVALQPQPASADTAEIPQAPPFRLDGPLASAFVGAASAATMLVIALISRALLDEGALHPLCARISASYAFVAPLAILCTAVACVTFMLTFCVYRPLWLISCWLGRSQANAQPLGESLSHFGAPRHRHLSSRFECGFDDSMRACVTSFSEPCRVLAVPWALASLIVSYILWLGSRLLGIRDADQPDFGRTGHQIIVSWSLRDLTGCALRQLKRKGAAVALCVYLTVSRLHVSLPHWRPTWRLRKLRLCDAVTPVTSRLTSLTRHLRALFCSRKAQLITFTCGLGVRLAFWLLFMCSTCAAGESSASTVAASCLSPASCATFHDGLIATAVEASAVLATPSPSPLHIDLSSRDHRWATSARGLVSHRTKQHKSRRSRGLPIGARAISLVVDSGASWHIHPHVRDLVNVRECTDTMSGLDRIVRRATHIGDLPVLASNGDGSHRRVTIKDVRVFPDYDDSLLSVRQLWKTCRVNVTFGSKCTISVPDSDDFVELPFEDGRWVYQWHVVAVAGLITDDESPALAALGVEATARGLGIHRPTSTSHITTLPSEVAAQAMHRRLHAGIDRLRRLPRFCSDAPPSLSKARDVGCDACTTANATRASHSSDRYERTYPGRVIHADIAGPFKGSKRGGSRYMLVLVDDHSRFKTAYFLKKKSDAPACIRAFVSSFTALLNRSRAEPTAVIGSLHTDNAGEFISREFSEFLDDELISLTTCPPHVHALNGVAERAIRSIMELVRSSMLASGCPLGFWDFAVDHAVDVLNRTTGPPGSELSSYEEAVNVTPRIMSIMPFGCRTFAVKPRVAYSKTNIEPHAWSGMMLGRSLTSPGAYHVFVPSTGAIVCTSDVYVDETFMPWLPAGSRRIGTPPAVAADADADQPPGLPSATPEAMPSKPSSPALPAEFKRVTRSTGGRAARSLTVLVLLSGPYNRPDGLAAFLSRLGLQAIMIDNDPLTGGGREHDLLRDSFYEQLLQRAHDGEFLAILAAPPR